MGPAVSTMGCIGVGLGLPVVLCLGTGPLLATPPRMAFGNGPACITLRIFLFTKLWSWKWGWGWEILYSGVGKCPN